MSTPANTGDYLAGITGAAGSPAAGSPTGQKFYGVPDDYAAGAGQPQYTTASHDDRRLLLDMGAERLADLQAALAQVGLIGSTYRRGVVDESTRQGFSSLLGFANQQGTDWRRALAVYAAAPPTGGKTEGVAGPGRVQYQTNLNTFERTDPARIRLTAESAFQEALGRKPKPAEMAKFVKKFQDTEYNQQRTQFSAQDNLTGANLRRQQGELDSDYRARVAAASGAAASSNLGTADLLEGGEPSLDRFMSALSGQESGGNYNAKNGRTGAAGKYQIMPSNWSAWSKEAGLPAGAARTPENQEIVARFKLGQYKQQFGTWENVAVAWYAGPGAVAAYRKDPNAARFTKKQGKGNEPSIRGYAKSVATRLGTTDQTVNPTSPESGEAELSARLQALIAAAPGKVGINNQRRTRAQQQVLYDKFKAGKGARAAKPGSSRHESGEAADLAYDNDATRQWVLNNAEKFGLVLPVGGETWHIETARGQVSKHGVNAGQKIFAATPAPTGGAGSANPAFSAVPQAPTFTPGRGGAAPISQNISVTQADLSAQAVEAARNSNPTETKAYDIGGQFQNLISLLGKPVI